MLKTIAMTAGSIDFDSTFRLDLAGMREEEDVHYLHLSGLLWIIFIMPILFANMLVNESDILFKICMHVHAHAVACKINADSVSNLCCCSIYYNFFSDWLSSSEYSGYFKRIKVQSIDFTGGFVCIN